MVRLRVSPKQFNALLGKLTPELLTGRSIQQAYWDAANVLVREVESRRPTARRAAIGSPRIEVDNAPIPRRAIVRVGGKTIRGKRGTTSVPVLLNFSPKHHYASGGLKGYPTRYWFTGATRRKRSAITTVFNRLAKRIEAAWQA